MNKRDILDKAGAVFAVVAFYGFLHLIGITCPIKFATGVSCPGCGMTRAYLSLLRLDFQQAFYFHPLFWLPPVAVIIFGMKRKIPPKFYKALIFTMCAVFVIVYIYRMSDASNHVVVCNPEDGAVFRAMTVIKNKM